MHTATYPKRDSLTVKRDGRLGGVDDVFPGWDVTDRFGVIVDRPGGVIGASLLVQVAALLFYEALPARSSSLKRYPEVYAFLLGGPKGDLGMLDFYPARKEVAVPNAASAVLDAILDRGITRLAVVEGLAMPSTSGYGWEERNSAQETIRSVYVYNPAGRVSGADLQIAGTERTETNVAMTIWPNLLIEMVRGWTTEQIMEFEPQLLDDDFGFDAEAYVSYVRGRESEISGVDRLRLARQRAALSRDGTPTESYRTATVDEALSRLCTG